MSALAAGRGRRIAVVGLVALALASAGMVRRSRAAEARWREARDAALALEAELDARPDERPALWGETTDGRAQPHYDRALALVADLDVDRDRLASAARAEDEASRRDRAELVAAGAEALAALRRGAHAADATRRVDWPDGAGVEARRLMDVRQLVRLCEMKFALLLEEGRDAEAVGVLLDGLQLAGDLTRGPLLIEEMVGLALLAPPTLVDGVADGTLLALSAEARRRLAAGLTALNRRLAWRVAGWEGELVLQARILADAFDAEGGRCGLPADLRAACGAGDRREAAGRLDAMRAALAGLDRAYAAGPDALSAELARLEATSEGPGAPVGPLLGAAGGRLYSLGRFRLLAHAVAGTDPPADPWLSALLRTEPTEAGTRLSLDHELFDGVEVLVAR